MKRYKLIPHKDNYILVDLFVHPNDHDQVYGSGKIFSYHSILDIKGYKIIAATFEIGNIPLIQNPYKEIFCTEERYCSIEEDVDFKKCTCRRDKNPNMDKCKYYQNEFNCDKALTPKVVDRKIRITIIEPYINEIKQEIFKMIDLMDKEHSGLIKQNEELIKLSENLLKEIYTSGAYHLSVGSLQDAITKYKNK